MLGHAVMNIVDLVSHALWVTIATMEDQQTASEPIYTAEQIKIPPNLPDILKDFTKAAIKTQPSDLLEWSAA